MATTATVTKPSGIVAVHVPHGTTGDYHRFEPNQSSTGIQKPGVDDTAFATTSVTFTVSGNTVTPTLPGAMRSIHVVLSNGHYYRLRNGVAQTVASGDASLFGTVSFTAA